MTKTISFAALHFTVAFLVGWAVTGSWLVGGTLAGAHGVARCTCR